MQSEVLYAPQLFLHSSITVFVQLHFFFLEVHQVWDSDLPTRVSNGTTPADYFGL